MWPVAWISRARNRDRMLCIISSGQVTGVETLPQARASNEDGSEPIVHAQRRSVVERAEMCGEQTTAAGTRGHDKLGATGISRTQ